MIRVTGEPLAVGEAAGLSLALEEPLSFWGGIDPADGTIIDRRHPQAGASTAGRILIMPHGRGSSTGAAVLAECIRASTGPAGIILQTADHIITIGVLAAAELYPDRPCPLVVAADGYDNLVSGVPTRIHPDGTIEQQPER